MVGVVAASDVDAHVRQLLDQRSAHSACFSSYSDPDCHSLPYPFNSPTSHLDDPSSSILDLDDDSRSSMASYQASNDTNDSEDDLSHMSSLGPKMRFHSKAPWELENDTLDEVDETDSVGHGSFISKFTGARQKSHKPEFVSSPRPSTNIGRPSVESSRSLLNSKRSFDTTISVRGNIYALAQESLSTSSLGRPHQTGRQDGLRGKFHLGRLRSQSSNVDIPSSPDVSAIRLPSDPHPPVAPPSPRTSCDTTSSTLDVQAGLSALSIDRRCKGGIHPYANPDLVISYAMQPLPPPKSPTQYLTPPRKDSNNTITESSTATAKNLTKSAPTPEMSAILKRRISHVQGKGISSPVSALSPECSPIRPQFDKFDEPVPPLPIGANSIPGWTDRNINPGFSLISLEEARAQRMRATTIHPVLSSDSASSAESTATTSFNHSTQETSTTLASGPTDGNYADLAAARARARSVSAGAKAKNALSSFVKQPERRGSENGLVTSQTSVKDSTAAGKSLKHKKSGFMRLFGNGKGSEKDAPPVPQPPSVPPLPQSSESTFTPRHNPKLSSHRIPVPSLSPSLLEAITHHDAARSTGDLAIDSQALSFRRGAPPPLTISTSSSPSQASAAPFAGSFYANNKFDIPQSAPANVSGFPALKLRPVSTLFSTHFSDQLDVTKFAFNEEPESIGPKDNISSDTKSGQDNERLRQDSLASGSISSGPSSATPSFMESQYNLSPIALSYTGTALTTPTTGGLMSPTSTNGPTPWGRERDLSLPAIGGRYSVDHQSAPPSSNANSGLSSSFVVKDGEATTTVKVLQEHLDNTNKMWQKRVWDLENEVRALKNELTEMRKRGSIVEDERASSHCAGCGAVNGIPPVPSLRTQKSQVQILSPENGSVGTGTVLNRPRARTGGTSRFVNGQL